jgi:hypothetical protein
LIRSVGKASWSTYSHGTNSPTTELSRALASVARLVQYCINTCSAVDAAQRTIPLLPAHGRQSAATNDFRRKGRPGERHRSVGRTGFREMIASGWRTAPPQVFDFEVVLATNSACQLSLEASPRVPDLPGTAPSASSRAALTAELSQHLAPAIEFCSRASASRTLSAPR